MPFETLLIDKHLGNSHPTLEYGERVNTGNEPVYGVLPVSPETLKQGLHPLTQPGVHVPYFYDFQSAADHALSLSEKAGGTVGGMQVGVTFLARTTQEPRFDKLPMATLGDIVHRREESPNPGTQAPEAPEEPGMDEIEEEIE